MSLNFQELLENSDNTYAFVGDEARKKKGLLTLKYPIEYSVITNYDDIEVLWQHVFENVLRVSPGDQPLLCSETVLNPRITREKTTQVLFYIYFII